MTDSLTIVVEGFGKVVYDYYLPALKRLEQKHESKHRICFVDKKENLEQKELEDLIKPLEGWAEYINKATDEGREAYQKLQADIVFIATPDVTHIDIALDWLEAADKCRKTIFIEKPLDSNVNKARKLLPFLEEDSTRICALDHYRVRMIPIQWKPVFEAIISKLGGKIREVKFYLLEDGSADGIGPIENENRVDALREGITLDLFPHVLALLNYFGFIRTFRLKGVRVARYSYIDDNGEVKEAGIDGETFAHIEFSFKGFLQNPIIGNAYIGKGISGCSELGLVKDVKRLELLGENGCICVFDLRNPWKIDNVTKDVIITEKDGTFLEVVAELYSDPYGDLIERVVYNAQSNADLKFELSYEEAKNYLEIIDEIRQVISLLGESGIDIPKYTIGKKVDGASGAHTLEQLNELLRDKELKHLISLSDLKQIFNKPARKASTS